VIETAIRTVCAQLQRPEVAGLLRDLPQGPAHKIRQPDGPPSTWPDILPGAPSRNGDDPRVAEAV
jgi:hypothetical protein